MAIVAGALVWFSVLPRNLGPADESYLLVEANRLRQGERLYRDVFWFAMPGAHWALAAVFGLFGVSITTAKMAVAVVNAATAGLAFATARALGVRRPLAIVPPLAFLALAQPAWPYVSPHWLSTAFTMTIFALLAAPGASERPRRLFAAGLAIGALAAVHQQKGAALALGCGAAVLLAAWVRRGAAAPSAIRRLALLAAGAAAVMVPVLAVLLATVDLQRLIDDTVRFPITGYRPFNQVAWGAVSPFTLDLAAYTYPSLLSRLPVLLLLGGAIAGLGCAFGWPRWRVAQWGVALLVCASAALAIGYQPDFIHIAFMATPFFVFAALLLDTATEALPRPLATTAGALVAGALGAVLVAQMARNDARMRADYPIAVDTAFGRVDARDAEEAALPARVAAVLDQTARRELFTFPSYASLYLTAVARNPTRHQMMIPFFNLPEHFAEIETALDAKRIDVVVVVKYLVAPDHPLLRRIQRDFDLAFETRTIAVYRRRTPLEPAG